jgi:hypothetical protein
MAKTRSTIAQAKRAEAAHLDALAARQGVAQMLK